MQNDRTCQHLLTLQRLSRSLMYLGLAFGGGLYIAAAPSPSIVSALGPVGAEVWAAFMCAGGALCVGSWRGRMLFEYVGLPLVITSMFLFGASLLFVAGRNSAGGTSDSARFVLGIVFIGLASGFLARLLAVNAEVRERRQQAKAARMRGVEAYGNTSE